MGRSVFQSLFYWILLTNEIEGIEIDKEADVSILVLLDLAHESKYTKGAEGLCIQFQSLFYWILLTNSNEEAQTLIADSFNPCFIGSCSRIGQKFPLFS